MKTWQKVIVGIAVCGYTYWGISYLKYQRYLKYKAAASQKLEIHSRDLNATDDPDDRIVVRAEHPTTLQDEKNLKGRTLWVSDGGQMDFYPLTGKSVDFSRSAGVLLGAQKILVKDAVEQVVPKSAGTRFPDAQAELLLVFTLPDDVRNPAKEYAVAVGDREGHDYNVLTDQLFFYDDPHQLYASWGPKVWQAIDQHTAIIGMTEHQLRFALGQVSTPRGDMMGDRSVEFDNQGKPKLVTFVNGKATEIRNESQ
jgi:hypothetical protein